MTQERINNLMILNVHKELTDEIDLTDIAKEFIGGNESRKFLVTATNSSDFVL